MASNLSTALWLLLTENSASQAPAFMPGDKSPSHDRTGDSLHPLMEGCSVKGEVEVSGVFWHLSS